MKYIVYCTTCTENGKIYIGVHKTENPEVFDGYIGNGLEIGWSIKNPKTAFQYAVKKYGYSKFKRNILYIFDNEQEAYNKEREIVTLEFIKRKDNYNTALGGRHSGACFKTLYQYDLEGNLIKEWISVESAIKFFNCNSNRFNMVVAEKRSAFNSYWTYEYHNKLDISKYSKSFHDCITYQYALTGELIRIFNSIKEIIEVYPEFDRKSIAQCRSSKIPLGGFYFVSEDVNIINVIKTRELVLNLTDKSISKYKNGLRVHTYSSISKAARENKISSNTIKKSIKNNEGIWSYGYSETFQNAKTPKPIKVYQYDLNNNLIKTWNSLAQCQKVFPKAKMVIKGERHQTGGFIFKIS